MPEKEKRIVFRIDEETWTRYDDKRHFERTSFQELGESLWANWAAREKAPSALTPHEAAHVDALLYALRTQNETKLHQIQLMLKPFLGKTEEQPAAQSPSRRKSA